MKEIWKPVVGYEGLYEVSNLGRVRSLDRIDSRGHFKKSVVLKQRLESPDRYYTVSLYLGGKRKLKYVHRLVAESFITNKDNFKEVNHKDECKTNNHVYNLEWCDRSYNSTYGKLKDHFKGSNNPSVKLTVDDVKKIRELISQGLSDSEIASTFNVTIPNVSCIRRGESWGWLA